MTGIIRSKLVNMHEFALAQDIVSTISEKVTKDLHKVASINLEIGTFCGVVIDSLDFGLKVIFESNNIKGIKINMHKIASIAQCRCGEKYQIADLLDNCPVCQSLQRKLISGTELFIRSVELKN